MDYISNSSKFSRLPKIKQVILFSVHEEIWELNNFFQWVVPHDLEDFILCGKKYLDDEDKPTEVKNYIALLINELSLINLKIDLNWKCNFTLNNKSMLRFYLFFTKLRVHKANI